MLRTLCAWGCALVCGALLGALVFGTFTNAFGAERSKSKPANKAPSQGQRLFEHVWRANPGDVVDKNGDGLGPLFNERSCVACHFQGGIGGAGPNANNVVLLTAESPTFKDDAQRQRIAAGSLHPGFTGARTIVLHRFSTNPTDYQTFVDSLIGLDPAAANQAERQGRLTRAVIRLSGDGPVRAVEVAGRVLKLSERNTPPLFGMGLIASISQSDIEQAAGLQRKENPAIDGRFVGRFGWRGQTLKLADFVRGACATELGLQVSRHPQALDPSDKNASPLPAGTVDLTDRQCDDMIKFVSHLPAPRRLPPADRAQSLSINRGEHAFQSAGCAVCHRETLGGVSGIYSDLLLHDMGIDLADPASAPLAIATPDDKLPPERFSSPTPTPASSSTYYGSAEETPTPESLAARQLWKTPPLWGLGDSGPYLHDGRAETIDQAITAHGGEASEAVKKYLSLKEIDRVGLVAFLSTLAAPDPKSLPQPIQPPVGLADNR